MVDDLIDSVLASLPQVDTPEVDTMPLQNIKSELGFSGMLPIRARTLQQSSTADNGTIHSSAAQQPSRSGDALGAGMGDGFRDNPPSDRFNQRLMSGPLPIQGSPQDRFRREVLGFNHYDPRHAMPEGNNGRMATGSALGLGQDYHRGSFQGFNVPVPTQPATASIMISQPRTAPVVPAPGLYTRPSPHLPFQRMPPTQLLSQECQRRHFNPEWQEAVTPDGKYTCKVLLPKNVVVSDGKVYHDPVAAKQQAAVKALPIVRSWPIGYPTGMRVPEGPRMTFGFTRRSRAPEVLRPRPSVQLVKREDADTKMTGTESNRNNRDSTNDGNDQKTGNRPNMPLTREQTEFFEQMRRTIGMTLPDPSKDSEEVQRAFLDGLALGSRLRRDRSSRSRSPRARRASPVRGYERDRSPARVRLTPPPRYDRWTGRPHTDRWRPDEDPLPPRPRARESAKDEQQEENFKMEVDGGKRAASQP
ncbi:hypothetical protein QBC44DRAFT_383568 [Cladorrhinum sp. PSN332]|nr:hypothetical protein QBC44DRAFT_383568 [Cladorrhinum sp. PSN332]